MTAGNTRRAARIDNFIDQHLLALVRQGGVVISWRQRAGRQLGPYHRLECRLASGARASIYLGADGPIVASVRRRLEEIRKPLRQKRQLAKVYRHLRWGAMHARQRLSEELSKHGLRRQGSEIRGLRRARQLGLPWPPEPRPSESDSERLEN